MRKPSVFAFALACLMACGLVAAQQSTVFTPGTTSNMTASSVSANVAISANAPSLVISNEGAVTVYVKFGADSTVVATTSDLPILAGSVQVFGKGGASYVAAVTASSTAKVYFTPGYGQ